MHACAAIENRPNQAIGQCNEILDHCGARLASHEFVSRFANVGRDQGLGRPDTPLPNQKVLCTAYACVECVADTDWINIDGNDEDGHKP